MRVEVFKQTNDNWCGSYKVTAGYKGEVEKLAVRVVFNGNIGGSGDPVWRTCVWGTDDCGMEFDCDTEAECWNKFLQVIGMEFVDMVPLNKLGFVSA